MKLLTPKLDFIFKKLLAGDTVILTDLLNSVLKLTGKRRIRSVERKSCTRAIASGGCPSSLARNPRTSSAGKSAPGGNPKTRVSPRSSI